MRYRQLVWPAAFVVTLPLVGGCAGVCGMGDAYLPAAPKFHAVPVTDVLSPPAAVDPLGVSAPPRQVEAAASPLWEDDSPTSSPDPAIGYEPPLAHMPDDEAAGANPPPHRLIPVVR